MNRQRFLILALWLLGLAPAGAMEGFVKLSTAVNVTVTMIDSTDHVSGKTGLTLTIYATKAAGTPTSISPTVTQLDSTNTPGLYKLALTSSHTDTLGELELHITASGADPADYKWQVSTYLPGEAATLQADQAVNTTKVGGTTQTARDLGASVLLSSGTGTGQLDFTSGVVKANLAQILGTALTETAGQIAAAFKQFFDVASPTGTMKAITNVVTTTNLTTNNDKTGYSLSQSFPTNFSSLSIDGSGRIDLIKIAGTTQTARDLGASVLLSPGTGTGQISLTSGAVTVGTNNDKTGYSLSVTPPTAADNADAVWDEVLADHLTSGTTGAALNAAGAAGDPWSTTLPGAYGAGTAGKIIGDNINATISSRMATFTLPTNFSSLSIDGSGRVDVIKIAGTTQTARDLGASVLLSPGTGTGQISLTSGAVTVGTNNDKTGYSLSVTPPTAATIATTVWQDLTSGSDFTTSSSIGKLLVDDIDATISSRSTYAGADTSGTTTLLSRLTSGRATNLDNLDALISDVPTVGENSDAVWDEVLSGHLTGGTTGAALNGAGSAGDPWTTVLPGSYGAGTAGKIVGDSLDAAISSRSTYAGADTSGTITLLSRIGSALTITGGLVDVNDKTGFSLVADPPTSADIWAYSTRTLTSGGGADPAAIADAVWDEALSGHTTTGTAGKTLSSAGSAGDPWGTLLPGSYTPGTAGAIVGALNPPNVTVVSPVSQQGNKITVRTGDTWPISITGLGDITSRTKLWFAVNAPGAADSAAKIFIEEAAGLTVVNGAAYATPGNGAIAVDDATLGNVTITVDEAVTTLLSGSTNWAIKERKSDGSTVTLSAGSFVIAKPGIEAIQ